MSNSTFNDRFNAWKNGASYWKDIRGIDLYNNSNTKQEDQPTMTHDEMQALNRQVNSIVQHYDNGKDGYTLPEVTITADYPHRDRVYNVADNSTSNFVSRLKDENRKTKIVKIAMVDKRESAYATSAYFSTGDIAMRVPLDIWVEMPIILIKMAEDAQALVHIESGGLTTSKFQKKYVVEYKQLTGGSEESPIKY